MSARVVARRFGFGCVAFAASALLLAQVGPLVVGTTVVRGWQLSGPAVVVGIVLLVRTRPQRNLRDPPLPRRVVVGLAVVGVVAALVTAGSVLSLIDDKTQAARWTILPSASASGCRLAVREESFLFAGAGTVYAGRGPLLRRRATFATDGAYRPISRKTYMLTWSSPDRAELAMSGPLSTTVRPSVLSITC